VSDGPASHLKPSFEGGKPADWPSDGLEPVSACPVCGSVERESVHQDVADWSFGAAPGLWRHVGCRSCHSLYLDPRPTRQSIGLAYATYYTHEGPGTDSGIRGLKVRWKNERLSARFARSVQPRLHLPASLQGWVRRRANRMALPFGWTELAGMAPGRLMDVGCGSGSGVALASQLGWHARGIEMDDAAVNAARHAGLDVEQAGYERLFEMSEQFDAITCSHVIEHVFDPVDMIRAMHGALRPGGVLLLATPNALSDLHLHFGKHWRGLEAPRHLVLFVEATLTRLLAAQGFMVTSCSDMQMETARESARIARGDTRARAVDRRLARRLAQSLPRTATGHDFIKLIARRAP